MKARLTRHALLAALVMAGTLAPIPASADRGVYMRGAFPAPGGRIYAPYPRMQAHGHYNSHWNGWWFIGAPLLLYPPTIYTYPQTVVQPEPDRDARPAARSAKLVLLRQHPILLPLCAKLRRGLAHGSRRPTRRHAGRANGRTELVLLRQRPGLLPLRSALPGKLAPRCANTTLRRPRHLKESASHENALQVPRQAPSPKPAS
jgi:hypothetical protein